MKDFLRQTTALILAIALVMGVVVFPSHAAPKDIGSWVTVHKTNGDPDYSADGYPSPALLKSSLKITDAGGVTIDPQGDGSYKNIPAGAKINLTYAFSLADGPSGGGSLYTYETGDWFEIDLPEGLSYAASNGTIQATGGSPPSTYDLASWTISGSKLKFVLTADAADPSHKTKWAKLSLDGKFDVLSPGEDTTKKVVFGGETIEIERVPLPTKSELAKTGSYDASTNEIMWTVTITPPTGKPTLSYEGYTIVDQYSANQDYVSDSFVVASAPVPDADPAISVDTSARKISYTFPGATSGPQTITYKTKPNDFSGADGKSTFTNTVNLMLGLDPAADPKTGTVLMDWIDKTGGVTNESTSDPSIVKWTVTVKVPGEAGKTIAGASIVDELQKELKLLHDGTHPVQIKIGSAAAVSVSPGPGAGQFEYDTTNDANTAVSSQLTYRFPAADPPKAGTNVVLTFYTQAKDKNAFLDSNAAIQFTNKASLQWADSSVLAKSPSTEHTTSGSGTGTGGVGGGGLLAKSADGSGEQYFYLTKDVVKWTIDINRNGIAMTNAKIKDEVPAGQELLIDATHPLKLHDKNNNDVETFNAKATSGNLTYTAGTPEKFEYKLPTPVSDRYTLTYYTKITNWSSLYANGTIPYSNKVILETDGGSYEILGKKEFSSEMLAKSVPTAYDYDKHLVQWQLDINRNLLPLTSAKVTDTLPKDVILEISAAHPLIVKETAGPVLDTIITKADTAQLTITPATATAGDKFVYDLGDSANQKKITITFWAKVTDKALEVKWDGNKGFKNEAILDSAEKTGIKAENTVNIKNPSVTKTHDYNASAVPKSDTINWNVRVNQSRLLVNAGQVEDKLDPALMLVDGSVKLYEATVASSDGAITKGAAVTEAATADATNFSVDPPTVGNNNTLTVYLPTPTDKAYMLEFSTLILNDSINLKNTVKVSGSGGLPDNSTSSGQVIVNNIYTSGGSGSNSLTVVKEDNSGNPLAGAKFRLTNAGKLPIKSGGAEIVQTTAADGKALFNNLPSWTFYVEEIEPAPGYLIPSDPYAYGKKLTGDDNVTVKNAKALADIAFTKKGAKGELLSGGTFTLTGTDIHNNGVSMTESADASGIVKFTNVPLNKSGTNYTIKETVAPLGHILSGTTMSATVEYNASKTAVVVKLNGSAVTDASTAFSNTPDKMNIMFTKTGVDESGSTVNLAGGRFTLNGTDYNGTVVTQANVAADASGVVTFANIQIGNYQITEVDSPAGHLMPAAPAKIFDVKVEYNAGKTGLIATLTRSDSAVTSTYINQKGLVTLSFNKVDARDGTTPLSGGLFELRGKDYKGDDVILTAPSVGGTVTFTNVPIDNGSPYTIKELSPPSGYKLTSDTITARVQYNAGKTAVVLTQSDTKLENERKPSIKFARVRVFKTDEEGKSLAGAEFTLYSKGGAVIATAKSDSKGVADFGLIQAGDGYYIKETTPPKGYIADGKTVTFNIANTDDQSFTFANKKDPDAPKDPDDPDKPKDPDDPDGVLGDDDKKDPGKPGGENGDVLGEGDSRLPKTGDDFALAFWLGSLMASLIGITYILRKRFAKNVR